MSRDQVGIPKPGKGRFFPVSFADVARMSNTFGFAAAPGKPRPSIAMLNPRRSNDHGMQIAAYFPADELVVFSFPETLDPEQSRATVESALRELAELSRGCRRIPGRPETISFRAYVGDDSRLIFTKRSRRHTRAKYRGRDKMTRSGYPKAVKTDERVLRTVEVT